MQGDSEGWTRTGLRQVAAGFRRAVAALGDLGVEVREVEFPPADAMLLANRLLILAEAAAYHLPTLRARPDDYGPDVRVRLELGQGTYSHALHHRAAASRGDMPAQRRQ